MENNSILQKLDGLEARFEEVSTLITDPDVIADQNRFVKLTKEYKDLGDIMDARKRYIACLNGIKEAKDILANETDPEMKEMAREELAMNEELQPQLEEEIKIALIPKDPEDAKNVEMEIRAGTGGDEACLFAGDLFKMYKNYCESKGWQLSITYVSEGAVGGFKEMAWRDFEDKHPGDERVFYADVKQIDENTVECSIYDWMGDHEPLDVYTIDVRTGVGTNQAGEEIDLPQTGVTTKHPIAAVGSAIAATLTGLWLTIKGSRRKKDEE